ncbi:toxin glutamine deamidase domain-containing protein [Kitasatospora sp. MAP5-34]|uniref:toxin glutamine deamidase domain-containing protein n=1 Tax=Kitasatospora sp. MAP5-34 TaxID=3035102 RepID=UPI002475CAFF|nr:toxin glutamine deamidase domain-containing protein [Kitasatospora sp. MAP5-34]MDH6576752.1 hypothetical protein [Kitasatospora sp. MAP5-34]
MSRKLPEELVPVLAKLGHHWPEADEDGLRQAAGLWRDFGGEAEMLGQRGGASAQRVTGENSGGSVDAFADHWRAFSGGGQGYLDDAQTAAEVVAKAFDAAATATEHCKAGIVSVCTEVAEELKAAQAVEDKAKSALGGGILGSVAKVVTTAVVGGGELVAVEAAKLRVGALLDELGHEMEQGLKTALKEPAVTTLERLAPGGAGSGKSARSDLRTLSGSGGDGQLTGALGGGVAGGAAVAGVRMLSAKLGPDGRVMTDASGNPVLVDQNGKTVPGVEGVTVERDAHGRPIVGPDGAVSVVGADGMPVVGLAVGANGKPLTDATGQPLLVGADGTVAGSGLTLAFDQNGKPLTDAHGRPELLGPDGQPVPQPDQPGLKYGPDGKPLTSLTTLNSVDLGTVDPNATDPNAPGLTNPLGLKSGTGGLLGSGGPPAGGGPTFATTTTTPGSGGYAGPGTSSPVSVAPVRDYTPYAPPEHGGGGGGGWYRQQQPVQTYEPPSGGYDSTPVSDPGPVQLGPVSLHTDSVAVAPQPTAPLTGDPVGWGGSGDGGGGGAGVGGGPQRVDSPITGVSIGAGPVSGGPVAAGPVAGGVLGGVPGGGPVAGSGPVGGPVGGPMGGPAGGVPVGPVAPSAAGGPVGGQPGYAGAPGAPGVAGQIGVVGGTGGGLPGGGLPGGGLPGGGLPVQDGRQSAASRAAGAGVGGGAVPYRMFAETGTGFQGRPDVFGYAEGQAPAAWAAPIQPGQVAAAYLVAKSYGQPGVGPAVERPLVRTVADSRPYGHSGGLGPVDPAHQAELESRLPRREDLGFVPHPDPRLGDWPEALNGGGPREPGRSNNCVDLALSGLDTFAGRPVCSAPRLPDGPAGERGGRDRVERELGTHFRDLGAGEGALALLAQVLLHSGPGAQAVLLTLDEYGRSHTWNAIVHGTEVTFLDYQAGRRSSAPLHSADHGLWAIAVDARSRPLDLTDLQLVVPITVPASVPAPTPVPVEPEPVPAPVDPVPVEAPAPPRSRLTIHRAPASDSTRSKRR